MEVIDKTREQLQSVGNYMAMNQMVLWPAIAFNYMKFRNYAFTGFGIIGAVSLYGTGNSSVAISNVSCDDNVQRITDCTYENTTTGCNEVAVICTSEKNL